MAFDLTDFRLWRMLVEALPEGGLERIANADYGQDYDEHLAGLREIMVSGQVPSPMDWAPGEVVSLTMWSGDAVSGPDDAYVPLLCAVILLAEQSGLEDLARYPQNALITLVHCATTLGRPWSEAAMEFLNALQADCVAKAAAGLFVDDEEAYHLGILMMASLVQRPAEEIDHWRDLVARDCGGRDQLVDRWHDPWRLWPFLNDGQRAHLWLRYLKRCEDDILGLGS